MSDGNSRNTESCNLKKIYLKKKIMISMRHIFSSERNHRRMTHQYEHIAKMKGKKSNTNVWQSIMVAWTKKIMLVNDP